MTSAAARIATALLAVLGLVSAAVSARSLDVVANNADLIDLATAIEHGARPAPGYLFGFVGDDEFARGDEDCSDAVTRAGLTVAWAAVAVPAVNAPEHGAVAAGAMRAALRRLACSPRDGAAWLRFAMIAERSEGRRKTVDEALAASYRFAPAEVWVVEPRLEFATQANLAGATAPSAEFRADLQRFVAFEPTARVAAAYVAAPATARGWLRSPIDAQPVRRRREILIGVDRLGVDYGREAL